MKLSFGVLLSLIAAIHAADLSAFNLYNPNTMFEQANQYQTLVTALQEDIVVTITGLRSQLSGVLKKTSNATLSQVQDNIWEIFGMDAPVRELVFVEHNESSNCIYNLRTQLNMKTEFSGYDASNCLSRYNRSVNTLINSAFGILADFERYIVLIQMLVVNAFNGINIWTNPESIQNKFVADYNQQKAEWDTVKANIESFLATLESDILQYNTVLGTCYSAIQTALVPQYEYITNATAVCTEFDV